MLFIDASHLVSRQNGESFISPAQIEKIVGYYYSYKDVPNVSRVVDTDKLHEKNSLSVKLYVTQGSTFSESLFDNYCQEWDSASLCANQEIVNLMTMFANE